MNKKIFFLSFCIVAPVIQAQITDEEKRQLAKEQAIISEIKTLLAQGKAPAKSLTDYTQEHKELLKSSSHESIQELGELFGYLAEKKYSHIETFSAIQKFINAVKVYHEDFSIGMFQKGLVVKAGYTWWRQASKEQSNP